MAYWPQSQVRKAGWGGVLGRRSVDSLLEHKSIKRVRGTVLVSPEEAAEELNMIAWGMEKRMRNCSFCHKLIKAFLNCCNKNMKVKQNRFVGQAFI